MKYTYPTKGTCSRAINIELDGEIVTNIEFVGGCSGNTQGISAFSKGLTLWQIIERCEVIKCGFKGTSCPDQLAKALRLAYAKENEG